MLEEYSVAIIVVCGLWQLIYASSLLTMPAAALPSMATAALAPTAAVAAVAAVSVAALAASMSCCHLSLWLLLLVPKYNKIENKNIKVTFVVLTVGYPSCRYNSQVEYR